MQTPRPRILIDVDNCVGDYGDLYLETAHRVLDTRYTKEQLVSRWNVEHSLGLRRHEAAKVYEVVRQRGFCSKVIPIPEAISTILNISRFMEVAFVTKPLDESETWAYDRRQWLVRYFGEVGKNVISTGLKHMVDGDILIEDRPETIDAWLQDRHISGNKTAIGFLYAWPFNAHSQHPRFSSWDWLLRTLLLPAHAEWDREGRSGHRFGRYLRLVVDRLQALPGAAQDQ